MRAWWRYTAKETLRRYRERLLIAVAWSLPKPLVYWCAVRLGAHATTGRYASQIVPDLTVADALQRWPAH